MKSHLIAAALIVFCVPAYAEEASRVRTANTLTITDSTVTFADMMEQLRAETPAATVLKPKTNVVLEGAEPAFIFPAAGSAGVFLTESVLVNRLNRPQRVLLFYFPIGGGAANCNRSARALTLDSDSVNLFTDFVRDIFQEGGFGAVAVLGVDSSNRPDTQALIDGNARIYSAAAGGGTVSQNFPSMSIAVPPGTQSAFGLRSDEFYRTNWGIFNYDTRSRTFDLFFSGFRGADQQISREIPPCSLVQERVPGGPYGSLEVVFSPRDNGGLFFGYGSTVDNTSLDSFSVPARK